LERLLARGGSEVQRLDLVGIEEEAMSRAAQCPEILPGVVGHGDRELDAAVVVLEDLVHERGASLKCQLEDVAAGLARGQAHDAAGADDRTVDFHEVSSAALEFLPRRAVVDHRARTSPNSRTAPCRRRISSSVRASVRSRISRARGSESRISRRSCSVIARMFSTSIWSISPESNRSPGLSGAICG